MSINISLNTLDEQEIKVYNDRGWAYDLFTDEDKALLNEKIAEIDSSIKSNTSPRLYTNSVIVDLNNKLVVLSGEYKNPEIHSVFVINSSSETLAEWVKDEIIEEGGAYANSREQFEEFGRTYQSIAGIQSVGFFSSYDYSYFKGRTDTGQRAIYDPEADYYGYTKQFQDRTTDNSEAQGSEFDVKYQDRTDTEDLESNRYLLASALESVAKNEKERLTAEAYKGYVSQLNDMQDQLSEIVKAIPHNSYVRYCLKSDYSFEKHFRYTILR